MICNNKQSNATEIFKHYLSVLNRQFCNKDTSNYVYAMPILHFFYQ